MIAYTYLRLPLINLQRPWTASAWFDMVSANEWDRTKMSGVENLHIIHKTSTNRVLRMI